MATRPRAKSKHTGFVTDGPELTLESGSPRACQFGRPSRWSHWRPSYDLPELIHEAHRLSHANRPLDIFIAFRRARQQFGCRAKGGQDRNQGIVSGMVRPSRPVRLHVASLSRTENKRRT